MKKAGGTGTKIKFVNEIYKQGFAGKNRMHKIDSVLCWWIERPG